ncbi:S24 family peptidase [Spirosoma sp. SC4-14]|uniref:S24 family peptidase n=1 Tax=Spirosoma sp. SC4-14 TaxID=3128900 RepID=UPI0030D4C1D9
MQNPSNLLEVPHHIPNSDRKERLKTVLKMHFDNKALTMSEKTGLSTPDVSRLLSDKYKLRARLQKFELIKNITGVSVDWLESGKAPMYLDDDARSKPRPTDSELFAKFMATSPVGINELARRMNRSPSTVSSYQEPTRILSEDIKTEIVAGLGVSYDEVFGRGVRRDLVPGEPIDEIEYVELPMVPLKVRGGSDVARYWQNPTQTYRIPKKDIPPGPPRDWWIIEVNGDSMGDRLPSGSRVLAYRLSKESDWRLAPARVWAIQYGEEFVIKRVRANNLERDKGLLLYSDNPPPDPFFVAAEDIHQIWIVRKRFIEDEVY